MSKIPMHTLGFHVSRALEALEDPRPNGADDDLDGYRRRHLQTALKILNLEMKVSEGQALADLWEASTCHLLGDNDSARRLVQRVFESEFLKPYVKERS